jgi:hypothetical protein
MGCIGGQTARPMAETGASSIVGDVRDDRRRRTVAAVTATGEQAEPGYMKGTGLIIAM